MGHLVQKRQVVRSTKPNIQPTSSPKEPMPQVQSNELFLQVMSIIKLYTNDTGRFPIHASSGNQYIMIAYHCDTNLILAVTFKTRKDTHRLIAYDKMKKLSNHNLTADLKIIFNGARTEYKRVIKKKWNINYQLVPPNTHRIITAEQAIHTFKTYFIATLAGVAHDFPRNLWDLLLPQTEPSTFSGRQPSTLPDQPGRTFTALSTVTPHH